MEFKCLYCGHEEDFPQPEPLNEHVIKHRCPKCNAAMAPVPFLKEYSEGFDPPALAFVLYSNCILGSYCYKDGYYSPTCEGPLLQKKCLYQVFFEIKSLQSRLDDIQKLLLKIHDELQVKKSQKKTSDKEHKS